jgi:mercuric ion transport protein
MPDATKKTYLAASGGIAAAFASALCCAGPLIAVALGVSGAGIAARFEPLRPYFLAATAVLLGSGFWLLRREEQRACEPGTLCASPIARRRIRLMLWVATVLAAVFATFPTWSLWILD